MANSTTQNKQDVLLEHIRILGVEMAVIFLLYGLYAAFSFIAIYCLLLRGIRESRPRVTLFIITLFEFLITTSYLVLNFVFFLIIIPKSTESVVDAGPEFLARIDSLASKYRIATEFMLRFIFVFSDGIVIWRTWSLFPYKTSVKVLLSLCLLASSIYTEKVLQDGFSAVDDPRQNMMVIIPLLITNLVATLLVCHTACKDVSTPSLGIYSDAMPLIAALYPALIIMFTTLEDYRYGSQEEVILSRSIKFTPGSPRGQLSHMSETDRQEISVFISSVTTHERDTSAQSISFSEQIRECIQKINSKTSIIKDDGNG
ncbi:hypothetical protein K435DRAFT_841105 [Dendrothele bispora CBS 962.96]|uniref:Uncharacterized protein n=1 Tax=Dendrothele bispora (strain CBS 962.96) TaxID=1314807 RepID=A0A4S8LQJ0_DENBC|nr:hypothetical protein K435DRAFT_841105 [Dendrothele bispora CBS 962.96]